MSQRFNTVKRQKVAWYGPGEEVKSPCSGDFILTHGTSWTSKLIQFGQRIRIYGRDKKYTYWNHAAIIINAQGDIIEALGAGVKKGNLKKYKAQEYFYVSILASGEDREEAVGFAEYALGESYGWITIISIALSFLTGLKFSFGFDGQQICSGLVARALERTQTIFNREPSHITPADLAKYYQVDPDKHFR